MVVSLNMKMEKAEAQHVVEKISEDDVKIDEMFLSSRKIRFWNRRGMDITNRQEAINEISSLSEEEKLALTALSWKSPVTVLQELLSNVNIVPKYELVQIEGAIHEPTFRYRVAACDTVASGTGRSKKEAKHAAAKNLLDKLIGNPVAEEVAHNGSADESQLATDSAYDDNIPGNPIGTLQEMCMSRRWPPPTYEMTSEDGPPHERQFTIACVLLKHREVGTGKSKKLAKRQAANKMWQKLQDGQQDPLLANGNGENEQKVGSVAVRYAGLKNAKISALTVPHSHKVSSFHKNLKQSTGPMLDELQVTSVILPEFDCVGFLQSIASEQHFEVTYVDIEEKSYDGNCQCLVQLSTFPVAVCYGSALTATAAQAKAAQNALEYLRIMTRK